MEKNVKVIDEQGGKYGTTWAKRARGLVKNGRARFVSEDTICLARPPETNNLTEDIKMSDNDIVEIAHQPEQIGYSIEYILSQIAKIVAQTEYLNNAISQLGHMGDGENGDSYSPGNTLGAAKAQAIGDVVRCRETTNQQALKLYEKMYDDLKPAAAKSGKLDSIMQFLAASGESAEDVLPYINQLLAVL